MGQSIESWFSSLGDITKYALVFAVLLSLLASVGAVPVEPLLLTWKSYSPLQLYRPITAAFFFGSFSFPWLMSMMMFVTYLGYNEGHDYKGNPAGLVFMLMFFIGGLTMCSFVFGLYITSFPLTMALCWSFCKRNPQMRLSIFGFEFSATYFPWALMAFNFITGHSLIGDVCGVIVGHAFIFLHDVVPATHNVKMLETPSWLMKVFPKTTVGIGSIHAEVHPRDPRFAARPPGGTATSTQRHNWGQGRPLGSQ